jgi:hypothetical protein
MVALNLIAMWSYSPELFRPRAILKLMAAFAPAVAIRKAFLFSSDPSTAL